jgi:coenzyme F420 hydrogenase subunit beta
MTAATELDRLLATVVEGGYCIGCGACAALPGSALKIEMDEFGRLQARLGDGVGVEGAAGSRSPTETAAPAVSGVVAADLPYRAVCPFSGEGTDEDAIAAERFATAPERDSRIGSWSRIWVGHVAEDGYRERGAAGGMGGWFLTELLRRDLVDAVIHVAATTDGDRLFRYRISRTADEVAGGSRSAYYPIELSEVLQTVRETPGRYALVGIPCFITSVRLLARADPVLAERIRVCLGLFSGHLKSTAFGELMAWQLGVPPVELQRVDFRTKLADRPANRYGMTVEGTQGTVSGPIDGLTGREWGQGFFKYKACDYCDDISAEAADVAIGDAWLPGYNQDPKGTNVVVVRNPELVELFETAIADGRLRLEPLSADDVVRSQAGAFRHRREALPDRLAAADERGEWRPPKRLAAAPGPPQVRALNAARERLRERSHTAMAEARQAGSLEVMRELMAGDLAAYEAINRQRKPGAAGAGKPAGPGKPASPGTGIGPGTENAPGSGSSTGGLGRLVRGLTSRVRRER